MPKRFQSILSLLFSDCFDIILHTLSTNRLSQQIPWKNFDPIPYGRTSGNINLLCLQFSLLKFSFLSSVPIQDYYLNISLSQSNLLYPVSGDGYVRILKIRIIHVYEIWILWIIRIIHIIQFNFAVQ